MSVGKRMNGRGCLINEANVVGRAIGQCRTRLRFLGGLSAFSTSYPLTPFCSCLFIPFPKWNRQRVWIFITMTSEVLHEQL